MARLIIQSPTAECYYKTQQWGKNKFKAFQDRKIPLQGKNASLWVFYFCHHSSLDSQGFFLPFSSPFFHTICLFSLCSPPPIFTQAWHTHTHPHHPLTHSTPLCSLMQRHYSITGACQSSDRHECFIQ